MSRSSLVFLKRETLTPKLLREGRWNDRTRLAAEEARRRDRERDEEWLGVIGSTRPELLGEMKSAMEVSRRVKK